MCGIAGFSRRTSGKSSIPNGRRFAIAQALSIESRGRHATGFGWKERDDDDNVFYAKRKGPARTVAAKLDLPAEGLTTLLAHTRHLTLGPAENNDNNHPVVCDHIVAVHNGRIDNHEELVELSGVPRLGLVDSFAVSALLARQHQLGADHPTELLELVEGCASLAWIDANEPSVLHLARLSTRPLTVAWTRRGDLVFSSTRGTMLAAEAATKVGIVDMVDIEEGMYLRVEDGSFADMRKFHVNHPKPTQRALPLDMPTRQKASKRSTVNLPASGVTSYDPRPQHEVTGVLSHDEWRRLREMEAWETGIDWDNVVPRRGHPNFRRPNIEWDFHGEPSDADLFDPIGDDPFIG